MEELLVLNESSFKLIKISLKSLGKFSNFDFLKIYESDNYYEVYTVNHSENFFTKTKIGKCHWRVIECTYTKQGEQTIKLK